MPGAEKSLAIIIAVCYAGIVRFGRGMAADRAKRILREKWGSLGLPSGWLDELSGPKDQFRLCTMVMDLLTPKEERKRDARGKPVTDVIDTGATKMTIVAPPRSIPCDKRMGEDCPSRSGRLNIRAAIREVIDPIGRCVANREWIDGRGFRGTILIDASGSMRWTLAGLEAFAAAAPAATIAYYNGQARRGELVIAAKDGCRIAECWIKYGGNEIDYPALRWLLSQDAPHVLVSDLGFCVDEAMDSSEPLAALALARQCDVVLSSVAGAMDWLAKQ